MKKGAPLLSPASSGIQRSELREKIAGVTFDVFGTLIEPYPSVGHIYAELAREYGWSGRTPRELTTRFQQAWQRKRSFDYSRASWRKLVAETFNREIPNDFFWRLYARFRQGDVWRIYDEVPEVLAALRRHGLVLGIISNWDRRLRPLLTALNLMPFFQVVIISAEVGCQKPDRRIFTLASRQLGIRPERLLHIGDQAKEDLIGATAAGWSALKVTRHGRKPKSELSDLTALIEIFGVHL